MSVKLPKSVWVMFDPSGEPVTVFRDERPLAWPEKSASYQMVKYVLPEEGKSGKSSNDG